MEIEGIPVYSFGKVSSTMDLAEESARKGKTGIITAEEQSAGRGRYGRQWVSLPGGLYFSLIMREKRNFPVSEVISFSIVKTLESYGITCKIKLPNDIMNAGKKTAGILIVRKGNIYIAGIGINVNNDAGDPAKRTSIKLALGRSVEKTLVLESFVNNFVKYKKQFEEDLQVSMKNWSAYLIK